MRVAGSRARLENGAKKPEFRWPLVPLCPRRHGQATGVEEGGYQKEPKTAHFAISGFSRADQFGAMISLATSTPVE
jgi:hypothetical protein